MTRIGSVRFGSKFLKTRSVRFGSVRFENFSVRFGSIKTQTDPISVVILTDSNQCFSSKYFHFFKIHLMKFQKIILIAVEL